MDLFISLAIPFLLYEVTILSFTSRFQLYTKGLLDKVKTDGLSGEDRPFMIFNFLYMVWTIIGLFTPLWSIFLGILALAIIGALINKRLKSDLAKIKQKKADSILTIFLIVFLLIKYFGN